MHVLQELPDPIPIHEFLHRSSPESSCHALTGPGATRRTSRRPISLLSGTGHSVPGSCAMAALCTIMRASPGAEAQRLLSPRPYCRAAPNGPLPNSRRSPRPSRSFFTRRLISKSI